MARISFQLCVGKVTYSFAFEIFNGSKFYITRKVFVYIN